MPDIVDHWGMLDPELAIQQLEAALAGGGGALNATPPLSFNYGTSTLSIDLSAYAPLASPSFSGNAQFANLSASGLITPSDAGIQGITDGSNAPAGSVGEVITATQAANVPLTTGTYTACGSITLPPGDWHVFGFGEASPSGSTLSAVVVGLNTAVAVPPVYATVAAASMAQTVLAAPAARYNVTALTTIYMVVAANFATGTCNGGGQLTARRMR